MCVGGGRAEGRGEREKIRGGKGVRKGRKEEYPIYLYTGNDIS